MDVGELQERIEALVGEVRREGEQQANTWRASIDRRSFSPSALNLAYYMALRRRDLRPLQRALMALGLSSLGRLESRVAPTLIAVGRALGALRGGEAPASPSARAFFAGELRLKANTREILGASAGAGPVALLVTCPSEAADDPAFMLELARRGVEAVRINCAHDDAGAWGRMIDCLRSAETATGRRLKVFMDLAGPKIRTGAARRLADHKRVGHGQRLALVRIGDLAKVEAADADFAVECTLNEALTAARVGDRVFVNDGKLAATIDRLAPWGLTARVTAVAAKGMRLKPEKGLNFPDSELNIDALTNKDRADLAFVAAHADAVEFSFVQSAADVAMLQDALAEHRPDDWRRLGLVLKIETARAVRNLPELIVAAAGRQPTAIMIARGEMTDAAMAARAECVMLNKGPFVLQAIDELHTLFARMDNNQHKKTPRLRRLKSW